MSKERTTLEIIAPSVEEAVAKGLSDLGLPEDAVEIEILDLGTRGFLGLGSRQARVRLKVIDQTSVNVAPAPAPVKSSVPEAETQPESAVAPAATQRAEAPAAPAQVEEDENLRAARETVSELLEKMNVSARVTARYGEADESHAELPIVVDILGDDLSILIGRKSETLNALQYIANLMVGKKLDRWVALQLDVEGYRARRERALKQLAHRMAEQAVISGRRQVLEPMPASERRVIHMELRNDPAVTTESTGEEPNRKVMIILKK
jgi:spoIIIJ-associated protein